MGQTEGWANPMATPTKASWLDALDADPTPWLLEHEDPAVRHLALRRLLDRPTDDPEVREARRAAMDSHPIATILAAQAPEGWWVRPGSGYGPKYSGSAWQVIFLDQLGADGTDPRIRAAADYLLEHAQATNGGIGARGGKETRSPPPPSSVIHCLNGNVLRALIGFGLLDDERVRRVIAWQAAAVTGSGDIRFYASSSAGPGFRCGANDGEPCAWGASKVLLALARIPPEHREAAVQEALAAAIAFLLSRDPAVADYPMGYGNTEPNGSWFRFGFPSGYVTDVLQVVEGLCEAGYGHDPRLAHAIEGILATQDRQGRWTNRYAYHGKLLCDIDRQGKPSKWVTLRACAVIKAALGS